MTAPRAPRELGDTGRRLWRNVTTVYALEDHQLELLRLACVSADRSEEARQVIAADGLTVNTRDGIKTHPAVAVERDSTLRVARLLSALDLDVGAEPVAPTMPALDRARLARGRG